MVEVEKECKSWLTSALTAGRSLLFPLWLRELVLPQNHDSHGGKSHVLLQQQNSLEMHVVTGILPKMVYSAAFLLLLLFLH